MRVCEIFQSLQGEGLLSGIPMVFIRLNDCNLRCTWCDTTYAWAESYDMEEDDIEKTVRDFPSRWVCITGGEPLLQDLTNLYKKLHLYKITLETNGTQAIPPIVWKNTTLLSVSPKLSNSGMKEHLRPALLATLLSHPRVQVKFVVENSKDVYEAFELLTRLRADHDLAVQRIPIIFQPQGLPKMENGTYYSRKTSAEMYMEEYLQQMKDLWTAIQGTLQIFRSWDIRLLPQLHRLVFGPNVRKV